MSGLTVRQLIEGIEMSALEQVRNSEAPTQLELAVMFYGDEQMCDGDPQATAGAESAAKQYLDLQAELEFFRAQFPTAAKNYRNAMEKMKEIENG